jgi:cytochrome c oxidase assembly protein subunit 15
MLFLLLKKKFQSDTVIKVANFLLIIILLQMLTGFTLNYFDLAAWAQAPHILLATLMFGTQFYLFLLLKGKALNLNKK